MGVIVRVKVPVTSMQMDLRSFERLLWKPKYHFTLTSINWRSTFGHIGALPSLVMCVSPPAINLGWINCCIFPKQLNELESRLPWQQTRSCRATSHRTCGERSSRVRVCQWRPVEWEASSRCAWMSNPEGKAPTGSAAPPRRDFHDHQK